MCSRCFSCWLVGDFVNTLHSLKMRHVMWHPFSTRHLLVLSSDNKLRLYDVAAPDVEEQLFVAASRGEAMAFTFGAPRGWDTFTVFVVTHKGDIFALCPVLPYVWYGMMDYCQV